MRIVTRLGFAIGLVAAALGSARAANPRPCDLITPSEIASITGVSPRAGQPDGPDNDKDLAATAWTCGWEAGKQYVALSVIRFGSEAAATRGMADVTRLSKLVPEGVRLGPEPGPGEQALSGASPEGAIWVSRRGQTMLAVVYAGESKPPPAARREPMRRAIAAALERLR